MNTPTNKNIDFHFNLLCQIALNVTNTEISANDTISNEWIVSIIDLVQ
jgi:hypothetical protein